MHILLQAQSEIIFFFLFLIFWCFLVFHDSSTFEKTKDERKIRQNIKKATKLSQVVESMQKLRALVNRPF